MPLCFRSGGLASNGCPVVKVRDDDVDVDDKLIMLIKFSVIKQ